MRELLQEKFGKERVTFSDLVMPKAPTDSEEAYLSTFKYRLHVVASNIKRNELMILPQDVGRLGLDPDDFEVELAVRMSISIPYFFMPVKVAEEPNKRSRHWVVDGGLLSNFPIRYFDSLLPANRLPGRHSAFCCGNRRRDSRIMSASAV